MKKIKSIFLVIAFCLCPLLVYAQNWHTESSLVVCAPGLIESVLPPELHERLDDGLDLKVFGPDGKSRAFELYWRDDKSDTLLNLSAKSARLENKVFIWETSILPQDRIFVKSIYIHVLSTNYIGAVDIFGLQHGVWIKLASQSALYAADGASRGDIKIKEGVYEGFRLAFTAFARKPVPIGRVQAKGEKPGKDYARARIDLNVQRTDTLDSFSKPEANLTTLLPGSGIHISELEVLTASQFNGNWTLERQDLVNGKKIFVADRTGSVRGVEKGTASLKINVGHVWPDQSLNLKLTGKNDPPGDVKFLTVKVRLPRLVFLADMPGTYVVRTGLHHKAAILDFPSAGRMETPVSVPFGAPRINRYPTQADPSRKYQLKGAPFNPDGYAWRSDIKLSGPGYYRLILHRKGSLEKNIHGVRIVRDGFQYPYFIEQGITRECELTLRESHDPVTNTTTWYLELPQASARWNNLILTANGIFDRTIKVERDQPRPVQGVVWRTLHWSNATDAPSQLTIPLKGFPPDENKIRLILSHGDNQPVRIVKAVVTYTAPALHFVADVSDRFELYGGNESAHAPSYDMQLIEDQLQKQEPQTAELSEAQTLKDTPLKNALIDILRKNNWGLYAVLGILSFGLIAVIVFVFPKTKKQ